MGQRNMKVNAKPIITAKSPVHTGGCPAHHHSICGKKCICIGKACRGHGRQLCDMEAWYPASSYLASLLVRGECVLCCCGLGTRFSIILRVWYRFLGRRCAGMASSVCSHLGRDVVILGRAAPYCWLVTFFLLSLGVQLELPKMAYI